MVMGKCTGAMAASTKGTGKEVYNMEKEKSMCREKGIKKVFLKKMFLW